MAARCLNNTQAGARLANLYVLSCWLFSVTSRRFLTPFITHPFIVCELEGQEQWAIICPKKKKIENYTIAIDLFFIHLESFQENSIDPPSSLT